MSQEQEVEPSIIDYARFYGLIRDHLEPHPLQQFNTSTTSQPQQLEDTPDLFQLHLDTVRVPEERLAIDAGCALFLSSIAASAEVATSRNSEDDGLCTNRVRRMKQELPLLRSDHELDLLSFAPRILPVLEDEFLPLETVNEEADEGLAWPSDYHQLPDFFDKKSKTEKLEIASDALLFLQEALSSHTDGGEYTNFEIDEVSCKKSTKVRLLSPPLLPLSPTIVPYEPSSETGHLDLLSDHTSPTRDEARQLERMLFEKDSITLPKKEADSSSQCSDPMLLGSDSFNDIYNSLKGIGDLSSSPPPLRPPLEERKVEVPLEPAEPEQPPPWKRKTVSFSEALPELIPDLPPSIPRPENASSSDIDTYFAETIAPIATKAERAIEQEQLQEEDTTLRVTVPIMDFTLPVAPWKVNCSAPRSANETESSRKLLTKMKELHLSKHAWPLSKKAERELKWAPFPAALAKIETQESIPDNGSLEKYLARPERVDVNSLTWKPDGLRILDDIRDRYEEDLKEGTFPEEKDINSLIRKRKLALEADDLSSSSPAQDTRATMEMSTQDLFFARTCFSTNAMKNYLDMRRGVVTAPKSHHFPTQPLPGPSEPSTSQRFPDRSTQISASTRPYLPAPSIMPTNIPYLFVVSASFLSNRKLSRQIQHLFPSAEFIERDFNLHVDRAERPPSKPTGDPIIASAIADEADIILSPSTGLIWTTLQKIKQRSLPGQVTRSAVKERVIGARPKYERLLVLVSEDRGDIESSDCEALIEFIAFCSASQDEVQVTFIGGGDDELANWIVATMVKFAVPGVKLIQDETIWEVFLRRAGMNAFAAQVILGKLKPQDREDGNRITDNGLKAFVKMSTQDRETRFEALLGGKRVLGRVSKGLDAMWQS